MPNKVEISKKIKWLDGELFDNLGQEDDRLWSIKRLAKYLDVPESSVRDWCFKRTINFVKVGRHIRFRPRDIEAWLEARRK